MKRSDSAKSRLPTQMRICFVACHGLPIISKRGEHLLCALTLLGDPASHAKSKASAMRQVVASIFAALMHHSWASDSKS